MDELDNKSDSKLKQALQGAIRWVLVALGSFLIGGLLVFFTFYNPARQKLDLTNADLEQANETINTQSDQINTLQTENEALQTNLESTTLHVDVLKALSGLRGASLAVAADDYAGARLLLIQASEVSGCLIWPVGGGSKRRVYCHAAKRFTGID